MSVRGLASSILVTLLAIRPLGVRAQEAPDVASVRAAIEAGNRAYVAAYAASDAEALAGVYARDGARLSENGRMVRGHDAIARAATAFMSRVGPVHVELEQVDLWVIDDQAFETGVWSYTYTPPGETEKTTGGRYVTVWRRQDDGGWRILADMSVPGT